MEQIAPRIRIARVLKGFKQEYVADLMGIIQASYSKIERGQTDITVSQLKTIATILEVPVIRLLVDDEKEGEKKQEQ